jgi:hypothetical protein
MTKRKTTVTFHWDHKSAEREADEKPWKAVWFSPFAGGCIVIGDQDDLPATPGGWTEISRRELERIALREPRREISHG